MHAPMQQELNYKSEIKDNNMLFTWSVMKHHEGSLNF